MNKTDLIEAVTAASKGVIARPQDIATVVDNVFSVIMEEVAKGEKVQIIGFGSFERRERDARTVRNPRTGESIDVGPSKTAAFSIGKAFKDKVHPVAAKTTAKKETPATPKKGKAKAAK